MSLIKSLYHFSGQLLVLAILFISSVASVAADDPILAPGDRISYSVLGVPELDRIATIGLNGQVQVPLAGLIDAEGLTIEEHRDMVAAQMVKTPFRTTGADGAEVWQRISADLIFIGVAEYRPIYLMGDVRQNGEQPYRPGITLRQAIARAGGLGQPVTTATSELDLLSMTVDRAILAGDIAFVEATVARLEADLASISGEGDQHTELGQTFEEEGSARWLSARNTERQFSRSNSELQTQQMENRLEVLNELLRSQRTNLEIEQAALDRARSSAERGLAPQATVTDARRAFLQVSMQLLETTGDIHDLQLDLARTSDEFERLQYSQRVDLLGQIVDQSQTLETLRKRLKALDQRIALLGGSGLMSQTEPIYRIAIQRAGDASIETDGLDDIYLLPGDVVEVTAVFEAQTETLATQ